MEPSCSCSRLSRDARRFVIRSGRACRLRAEHRNSEERSRDAKPRYPAAVEGVDFTTPRGLARDVVLSLGTGAWIHEHYSLVISGPTGIGKSVGVRLCTERVSPWLRRRLCPCPRLVHDLALRSPRRAHREWRRAARTPKFAIRNPARPVLPWGTRPPPLRS
jgi:hypothetical protein